jgi:hypothetical protein
VRWNTRNILPQRCKLFSNGFDRRIHLWLIQRHRRATLNLWIPAQYTSQHIGWDMIQRRYWLQAIMIHFLRSIHREGFKVGVRPRPKSQWKSSARPVHFCTCLATVSVSILSSWLVTEYGKGWNSSAGKIPPA